MHEKEIVINLAIVLEEIYPADNIIYHCDKLVTRSKMSFLRQPGESSWPMAIGEHEEQPAVGQIVPDHVGRRNIKLPDFSRAEFNPSI